MNNGDLPTCDRDDDDDDHHLQGYDDGHVRTVMMMVLGTRHEWKNDVMGPGNVNERNAGQVNISN
jgi:hypothetical protein